MFKKILTTAAAAVFVLGCAAAPTQTSLLSQTSITASAETYNALEYSVLDNGTVEITGYTGSDTKVTIPSEIDGKRVTGIGEQAFYGHEEITDIIIPDSVTIIRDYAFWSCTGLTSIVIPDSVISIRHSAFNRCTALKDVTIPDSVDYIGGSAFKLTPWLDNMRSKDPFVIINDILIDGQTCTGKAEMPYGVKIIGDEAFMNCEELAGITISETVEYIGEYAFGYCTGLKKIIIPDNVESIGNYAFNGCTSLNYITFPDKLASIGEGAFISCPDLPSVTIPKSVISIGEYAFGYDFDFDILDFIKIKGFLIHCRGESAAQQYAMDNGFEYQFDLSDSSVQPATAPLLDIEDAEESTTEDPADIQESKPSVSDNSSDITSDGAQPDTESAAEPLPEPEKDSSGFPVEAVIAVAAVAAAIVLFVIYKRKK